MAVVEIYDIVEHGRRLYRSLVCTTDNKWSVGVSVGDMFGSRISVKSLSGYGAPLSVAYPRRSLAIYRTRRNTPLSARAGEERSISIRSASGMEGEGEGEGEQVEESDDDGMTGGGGGGGGTAASGGDRLPYPHLGDSDRRFDRAGEELYIPQRLLNGTIPDALLDTYVASRMGFRG